MMRIFLVLALIGASVPACAQDTSLIRKNHVRSLVKKEYSFHDGQPDGEPYFTEIFYSKSGRQDSVLSYFVKEKPEWKYIYRYDASGEHLYDLRYDRNGRCDTLREENYARQQYGSKWQAYLVHRKEVKDEKGRVVHEEERDYKGRVKYVTELKYDDPGHLTARVMYDPAGKRIYSEEMSYSPTGKLLLSMSKDEKGRITNYIKCSYDEHDSLQLSLDSGAYGQHRRVYEYATLHGKYLITREREYKKRKRAQNGYDYTYVFNADSGFIRTGDYFYCRTWLHKIREKEVVHYNPAGEMTLFEDISNPREYSRNYYRDGKTIRSEYVDREHTNVTDLVNDEIEMMVDITGNDTTQIQKYERYGNGLIKKEYFFNKLRTADASGKRFDEVTRQEEFREYTYTYY